MNVWPDPDQIEQLRQQWTDKWVVVDESRPELARFAGMAGRVVTINMNGKALVEFQEGRGRYDISPQFLKEVPEPQPGPKKAAK